MFITKKYLKDNPDHIFVFGDNLLKRGKGGAASLRDEINAYGFITKRYPSNADNCFYTDKNYKIRYEAEIKLLKECMVKNPDKLFLISKLGAGLANKYKIFEKVIEPNIKKDLSEFNNVKFLW